VFYQVGFGGVRYTLGVIVTDTSKLRNRALAYAFINSPYIITAFGASKAAEHFTIDWRWGFGSFAIIFPVVCAPLFVVIKYNVHKAKKFGVLIREKSGRTWMQSIWHYIIEFDGEYRITV
jgi:MFS family permease